LSGIIELKYKIPLESSQCILAKLKRIGNPDKMFPLGRIRTTYFDDPKRSCYHDTDNGENYRYKYRFREYLLLPKTQGAHYSVEVKIRHNVLVKKVKKLLYNVLPKQYRIRTFQLLLQDLEKYNQINLTELRNRIVSSILYPDITISYSRYRFYDKSEEFRMNFDTDIKVKKWRGYKLALCEYRQPYSILELKGEAGKVMELPNSIRSEGLSLSKYKWGIRKF